MPEQQLNPILRHLQQHFAGAGSRELTDLELLQRFAHHKDEAAFAALVQRHGSMVHGVCRRVLRRAEDAEDAFQATFLVLARKAAAVAWRESVGRWLYQVAYRLAAETRTRNARRDALAKQAAQRLETAGAKQEGLREVCAVLDESLLELPARYREPLVLCYLQGLMRDQAAEQLGWSLRTLERRLAQGRERLRQVLTRRGVTLSAALLAGALTESAADAAVSTGLAAATIRAAVSSATGKTGLSGGISATAAALAEGALCGTLGVPTRIVALFVLLLGLAAGALGVLVARQGVKNPSPPPLPEAERGARTALSPPLRFGAGGGGRGSLPARQDRFGDPLPPEVVARMGSSRFRHLTYMANLGVVVSPDSKTLLTTSEDGVRAWDAKTGKLLYQIREDYDYHPVFSPTGKTLAMIAGRVIYLRDPATGRKLQRIPAIGELPREPRLLAFSADGRRLAAALNDGPLLLFDAATSRQTGSLDVRGTGKIRADYFLVFAPDGRTLVSMGRDPDNRDAICHWDLGTQTLLKRVVPAYAGFRSTVRLSPDGRLVAVPSRGGPVTLFDTQTGKVHCTLQGDRAAATYGLAFAPDGKTLVTAWAAGIERDATASFWDTATGKLRRRFRVPMTAVTELRFSPDGRLLLVPGRCVVRLWDIATGKEVLEQPAHTDGVRSLAFTPDGRSIVSGGGETIRVWDARTGQQQQVMVAHRWQVNQVMVRPDGRTVVSCGADGTVRVYDLSSGKELRRCLVDKEPDTLSGPGHQIFWLGLAPDGRTAATFCSPCNGQPSLVHVWDLESGKILVRQPNTDQPFGGTFSPDARMLVTTRQMYEPAGDKSAMKDKQKRKAQPHEKAGAPSGPPRTTVVVREVATGRELLTLPQPGVFEGAIALTPDGQTLLTVTYTPSGDSRADKKGPITLRLWELATGKQRLAINSGSHEHGFALLAVAPDGRTLAAIRRDQVIQLWDLATGKELLRRQVHDAPVDSLAFSPDGKRLATGHPDSAILVWDVSAAYERRVRPPPAKARELEAWWQDLAGDAPQAHRAIWSLAGVPAQAVPLLRDRLRPAVALPADELRRLVQDLDSPRFERREEASRRLAELGEDAEPTLRKALADKPSAEARKRLERILALPRSVPLPEALRSLRALQILEAIGDEPARRVLGRLAGGAADSRLTREARAAGDRLRRR